MTLGGDKMRMRYNKDANDEVKNCKIFVDSKEKIQEILNSDENKGKKVFLEIGMGKGDFITKLSMQDKENIYIGVEISKQVLAIAIKKMKRFEESENVKLDNLYLMSFDALLISDIFCEHQIEKIYLNFSDPWPKKKHTKRRLTHENFLNEYKKILVENGIIEFKTDNRKLFEYSLVSMQNFGMKFEEVYLDLHKEDVPNILTEYEEKFSPNGPIYKLVAKM